MPPVNLKVAEAFQNDIGRGIARIDSKAKSELGVSTGDIIKLTGKKPALAIVWQAHQDDEGIDMIRMDGILRQNVGIGLGEKVRIEAVATKPAKKILLAPQEPIRYSAGFDQYVKKRLIGKPVLKGNLLPVGIFGTSIPLVVAQVFPQGPVMISEESEIKVSKEPIKEMGNIPNITYDDVGGLRDTIQKVREMIELPLRHPELFERLGIDPPKGVLLYGSPGTGKTLLAKAVANESDANFYYVGGPEIISKYVGESEERLRKLFAEAEENAPSIIFIDEIDAIAPKREEVMGEVEKRMVSQLLTIMDGLKARGEVIVIGATNRPGSIDQALRRPGRFDREIEISIPDKVDRLEILNIHVRCMPLEKDVKIDEVAAITHGYTGADLSLLTKEAAIKAMRRILPKLNIEEEILSPEILENLKVTRDDFFNAMHEIQPSALREVYVERPSVKWEDIGGLDEIKREIHEAVELPLNKPEVFGQMGIRPIKGILLYGPPGTGKTLL
jgi:transitional endoplasmic reticulum ATPase